MKLDTVTLQHISTQSEVAPGNIYPAKGGRGKPGTLFWLVVAVSNTGAHMIGFDKDGTPVSTASYTKSSMRERPVIGRIDMSSISLGGGS